jgi:hypothetical protein
MRHICKTLLNLCLVYLQSNRTRIRFPAMELVEHGLPPKKRKRPTLHIPVSPVHWYAIGSLLVAVTAWLRWLATPLLGDNARFLPFIVTVAFCTYGGGIGPGLVALGASVTIGTALWG